MNEIPQANGFDLQAELPEAEGSRPAYKAVLAFSIAVGIVTCAFAQMGVWLFVTFFSIADFGSVAGESLFKSGRVVGILIAALLWAPVFETLVAQMLPVELIRSFLKSPALCIFASALLFSAGHVLGGGGAGQALLTFGTGLPFAYLYVRYRHFGIGRSFVAAATAHWTNNAAILIMAYWIFPLFEQ